MRSRMASGLCHVNERGPRAGGGNSGSCGGDGSLPLRRRFGSKGPQRRSGDEVALKIECVVDGGMDAEEALGRASRLEPLHLALPSPHGLMGVLRAIVLSEALLMRAGRAELPESRPVGAELVGRQQFRHEALFPE